jgi:hypothetical protein
MQRKKQVLPVTVQGPSQTIKLTAERHALKYLSMIDLLSPRFGFGNRW